MCLQSRGRGGCKGLQDACWGTEGTPSFQRVATEATSHSPCWPVQDPSVRSVGTFGKQQMKGLPSILLPSNGRQEGAGQAGTSPPPLSGPPTPLLILGGRGSEVSWGLLWRRTEACSDSSTLQGAPCKGNISQSWSLDQKCQLLLEYC